MMMTQVLTHFMGQTYTLTFPSLNVKGLDIKHELSRKFHQPLPTSRISLLYDGKLLLDDGSFDSTGSLVIRASFEKAISGGKGGFGATLRYRQ